jgi:divalent metal cation (Fe/Co/Zn/Cd) transporter
MNKRNPLEKIAPIIATIVASLLAIMKFIVGIMS